MGVPAPCEHFGQCGGCTFQNLAYTEQLRHKQVSCAGVTVTVTVTLLPVGRGCGSVFRLMLSAMRIERWRDGVEDQAAEKAS